MGQLPADAPLQDSPQLMQLLEFASCANASMLPLRQDARAFWSRRVTS